MADPIPMRVHRHFKGEDKKYLVMGVSTDVDPPHMKRVIYVPLYGENAGALLSRRLDEWKEHVHRELTPGNVYDGPRFWLLPNEAPKLS